MNFADSVNRAAFFRMFGTCSSHADGCGLCCTGGDDCITTHDNLTRRTGVPAVDCNNQSGPTGPPGHDWHACNFTCPPAPSVQNGARHHRMPPPPLSLRWAVSPTLHMNKCCVPVTIRDLFLGGSTTFTAYYPKNATDPDFTSGFREHGAAIYFYQGDTSQPPIRDITISRVTVEGFAGDCIDVGGGVQNLVVEDIRLKDCLRQGVDFAGAVAPGDAPSANFTARRVRDLQDSPGVTRGGESRMTRQHSAWC